MTNFLKKLTSKSSQVPQISHSLFDEDRPNPENKSFWSKDNLITDNKRLNLSTGCFFNKKSKKKFGEVKSIYLYIYKNFLISSKNKEWTSKQYKSVDLAKNFVILQRLPASSGKFAAGIALSYNKKRIELYTKTVDELNQFIYQLKKSVIQVNFEELYNLENKLGSGSYADVYKVRDRLSRREYAAKFFDISSFKDVNRSKTALRNEITIHRQLEHGNICMLHEVFETPSHIILVMEYAKGERLIDYVIEHSPLPEKESMIIMKELLEGLVHLHSLDILHRDLKLENIMMYKEKKDSERITLKLIDFGLSVKSNNIELFKRSGTPGYVAPEVLLADTYDVLVDVFSAGVILFTMLSGRSPFVGPDRATVLRLNKKCEYTFKPKHWDNKSSNAKDLVRRMMDANIERRFSAKECLNHRWFNLIIPAGFQAATPQTMPKLFMSNRSLSPNPQDPTQTQLKSTERSMEKSRTTLEHQRSEQRKISLASQQSNRSNSIQIEDGLPSSKIGENFQKQKSNLLQIPQQFMNLSSLDGTDEDNKSEMDGGTYAEMMNKGSLRSFYKLNSEIISEDPHSYNSERMGTLSRNSIVDNNPAMDANTDLLEVPGETTDVRTRVKSLGNLDKEGKSPFTNTHRKSREISQQEVGFVISYIDTDKNYQKKESCDLTTEALEEMTSTIPSSSIRESDSMKASMCYIKMTTSKQF